MSGIELRKRKLFDITAPNKSTGIINGQSSGVLNWDDVQFPWVYRDYKNSLANFWTPFEIQMTDDKKQWVTIMSEDEKFAFKRIIGLLASLDSIQTEYCSSVKDYITDSSISSLMGVIEFQEIVHNQSYSYVLSSLVDKDEQDAIFDFWKHDPVIIKRNKFIFDVYEDFKENPNPETLLKSIVLDVVLEGLDFYSGFAFFYNLARNQKMLSTSRMINYINRDEQIHVNVFIKIFKAILAQYPQYDTPQLKQFITDVFEEAAALEIEWGNYIIGDKIDGINMMDLDAYIKFYANFRSSALGGERPFEGYRSNPLKWIKAYEDPNESKQDFFEGKSRQYAKVDDDNGFDEL
ncbi:ribonucleotide-diphosphate reductase beta subunit [Bacillus phage SP-15]|uniref:ribonucleoside-diphosphate reductase n=1 Tax=Bacillus phage SP-15 TaxID=1792032 RepID=A0A127AVZ3_9CAUD|nr:ribonucleotide-diphosphate reductase beta subunit [Bacillus phage SP-15]AMM44829.1 ribonucleotide-diphosphate reductase beta subunit [Bacillus phage SP-15]